MAQLYSKEQLREIFQSPFNQEAWKAILHNLFRAELIRKQAEKFTGDDDNEDGYFLGALNTSDSFRIGLFYFVIKTGSVAHKKVGLRNLVKQFVNPTWGKFDAAIVVFNDKREWRLSFVCDIKDVKTAPKRYTFVFGEHDNFYRTAIDRFLTIQNSEPTFENIRKAFSVDALSDDFFDTYRGYYADFVQYITGKRYVKEGNKWVERELGKPNFQYTTTFDCNDKLVRDYVKKMFGRIVFLYFLQRKGWLNGDRQYMHNLFYDSTAKDNFLDGVLELLFFEVLNTDKQYRTADANALPGSENIPYLNGGLFARDEIDELDCVFPEDYFKKLFDFLDSYNFTIDENDVDDAEIGIDPEMLGRIFENLLEDNKDKGAFYTPKEIVNYMCRESLIAYLQNGLPERSHELIRNFVENCDASQLNADQSKYLRKKLQDVKICDPAIGSGAFPMGLVNILSRLYIAMKADTDTSKMKRHIIENNIYGVDIEKGAVDIARLRFWLAMIVEEKEPMPLPNLHFKIMQGNSLLESIDGIDLSDLTKTKAARNLFDSTDTERENLKTALSHYYNTSNHTDRDRLFNEIINNVRRQIYAKDPNIEQAGLDPSANDKFFLWHTWFADVFDNGGFDIVIGNPPYVSYYGNTGQKLTATERKLLVELFTIVEKEDDRINLMNLMIEKGIGLLNKNGHLCFIVNKTTAVLPSYRSTRSFILKNCSFNYYVDDLSPFSAIVDCIILGISKCINHCSKFRYWNSNLDGFNYISETKFSDNRLLEFHISKHSKIIETIEMAPYKLGNALVINRGVNIGGCFDDFLSDSKLSSDYWKYISGTSKIKRFQYFWEPTDGYMKLDLNIEKHLKSLGKTIALGNPIRYQKPRLIIPESSQVITAAYCDEQYYTAYGLMIATSCSDLFNIKFLCALLNSNLITYYALEKNILRKGNKATPHVGTKGLLSIPLQNVTTEDQNRIIDISSEIHHIKVVQKKHLLEEKYKELNELIYDLYKISNENRIIIDEYIRANNLNVL